MNRNDNTNVYGMDRQKEPFAPGELTELGVTEEEIKAADRLLASVAEQENDAVDYAGMLRRIKAEAMAQGLAAAAAKKPQTDVKRLRMKRVLRFAAAAAAAFVVGLGVMGVIKAFNATGRNPDGKAPRGDVSAINNTAAPTASQRSEATTVPDTVYPTELMTHDANSTVKNTDPAAPTEVARRVDDSTPFPSEYAFRGGMRGYTYIKGFAAPKDSAALPPPALPAFMQVKPFEDSLGYSACGKREDGTLCNIECKLVPAYENDLPEGSAVYTLHDDGRVGYIWRIDEGNCMHIEFTGFDYSEAEELLLSYTNPEMTERYKTFN